MFFVWNSGFEFDPIQLESETRIVLPYAREGRMPPKRYQSRFPTVSNGTLYMLHVRYSSNCKCALESSGECTVVTRSLFCTRYMVRMEDECPGLCVSHSLPKGAHQEDNAAGR